MSLPPAGWRLHARADAAREFLELSPHLRVHVGDTRRALRRSTETYDLILGDAFHGLRAIPFHLVTREFHDLVAARLAPGGVYAINTMGHPTRSRLVASVTRTLRVSFRHVHHFGSAAGGVENVWVLASRFPLTLGVPAPDDPPHARVLTDDHAPVEFLVAMDLAVP